MESSVKYGGVIVVKPTEIRVSMTFELKRLIKALAGLRNTGRDWTMGECVTEAIEDWIQKPENQELIKKHSLPD